MEDFRPEEAIFYGPPTSWRGRLKNRLRRILGWEEQDEIYGYWRNLKDFSLRDGDTVRVMFGPNGVIYFLDEVPHA